MKEYLKVDREMDGGEKWRELKRGEGGMEGGREECEEERRRK